MASQASPLEFETGVLEASATMEEGQQTARELQIGPDAATALGFPVLADFAAQSKTLTFQGRLTVGGAPAATLDDATVTVTLMANPQTGVPFLFITFSYLATSQGFRTGRGAPTGEPLGMPQGLFFKNQSGGVMYSWGFPGDDFRLECSWNREFRYHIIREYNFVGWFDLWSGIEHRVAGSLFRC